MAHIGVSLSPQSRIFYVMYNNSCFVTLDTIPYLILKEISGHKNNINSVVLFKTLSLLANKLV